MNFWLALLGSLGMILGAAYMLYLYRRIIFGTHHRATICEAILDLSPREIAVFAPLVVLTLWMGVYPSSFTSFFDATVERDGRSIIMAALARLPLDSSLTVAPLMNWTLALPEIVLALLRHGDPAGRRAAQAGRTFRSAAC